MTQAMTIAQLRATLNAAPKPRTIWDDMMPWASDRPGSYFPICQPIPYWSLMFLVRLFIFDKETTVRVKLEPLRVLTDLSFVFSYTTKAFIKRLLVSRPTILRPGSVAKGPCIVLQLEAQLQGPSFVQQNTSIRTCISWRRNMLKVTAWVYWVYSLSTLTEYSTGSRLVGQ